MFLALEGIDGTGKSTQCRLLVEWLRQSGAEVVHCIEPGTTDLGKTIREWLLHHPGEMSLTTESLLFMAARSELVAQVIRPALDRGAIVVSDRYLLSTIVYQGHAAGVDVESLRLIGRFATAGIFPDRMIVLDLPLDVARSRLSATPDRLERRPPEYHERVRQGFLREAERDPEHCIVLSALESIETVQAQIRKLVSGWWHELGTSARP